MLSKSITEDDFGRGKAQSTQLVLETFAAITPLNIDRQRYENTQAIQEAYRFVIRWTDKIFNAIEWNGKQFSVNSVINVDEANRELIINAQRVE